jgi:hypothetical protein
MLAYSDSPSFRSESVAFASLTAHKARSNAAGSIVPFGALHLDQSTATLVHGTWAISGGPACTQGNPPVNESSSASLTASATGGGTFGLDLGNGINLAGPVKTAASPGDLNLQLSFTQGPESAQMTLVGYGTLFHGSATLSLEGCIFDAPMTLTLGGTGLTTLQVNGVSPSKLPAAAPNPAPTITVTGTGFTGATAVHFLSGAHGFFVGSSGFTVNAAGTQITLKEPSGIPQTLAHSLGPSSKYLLDVRVSVGPMESAVNAPADRILFTK